MTGKAAGGSLPDPMNSLVTTENTRATALSSASAVTEPSPGQTTSPYTWRGTSDLGKQQIFPPTATEIQYLQHKDCLPQRRGELILSTTDNRGEVFQRVEKRDNCIWTLQLCFFFIVIHLREPKTLGFNDWIFYHSICKSNLNYFWTTECQGVTGSHGYQG